MLYMRNRPIENLPWLNMNKSILNQEKLDLKGNQRQRWAQKHQKVSSLFKSIKKIETAALRKFISLKYKSFVI